MEYVKSSHFRWTLRAHKVWFPILSFGEDEFTFEDVKIPSKKLFFSNEICIELAKADLQFLIYMPSEYKTKELYEILVKNNGDALSYVPNELKTKDLCMLAYDSHHSCFASIPNEFKTPQMCNEAIVENGALSCIPPEMITYDMCIIAIKHKGTNIQYVPDNIIDQRLALLALENIQPTDRFSLKQIPIKARDHDVCLAAVAKNGNDWAYVPEEVKSYDICLASVKKLYIDANNIKEIKKWFPHEYFTPELCMILARAGASYFELIPKDCLTNEVCLAAVSRTAQFGGTVIREIPENMLTQEICDRAFKTSTGSFGGIPERFITEEMLFYLAEKFPMHVPEKLPERFNNKEFIEKLIDKMPDKYSGLLQSQRVIEA